MTMPRLGVDALRWRPAASVGDVLTVTDADGTVEPQPPTGGGGAIGEALIDDDSGEFLYDDDTGDILYDDGDGAAAVAALDDLTDVVAPSPAVGDVLVFDGNWVPQAPAASEGQDTAAGTLYVATTGSDTTGDGTSGAPYATVGKALSVLPRSLAFLQTIDVADGTYAEALDLSGFVCTGDGAILITGNTTTPANVSFTGTTSFTFRGVSRTAVVLVAGPIQVTFQGLRVNATADYGIHGHDGCRVTLDRIATAGTLARALHFLQQVRVALTGNLTIAGFTERGLQLSHGTVGAVTGAGTITVTGNSTSTTGIHLSWNSHLSVYDVSGCNFTISVVKYGFAVGLQSSFGHLAASSAISITNASTPGSSAAVLGTDHSTWAANGGATLTVDHFTNLFELNSLSYGEHIGSRTITNTSSPGSVGQNSVTYLP